MNKRMKYCLDFAKKYPNEWHGFSQDKLTIDTIKRLDLDELDFIVDWKTKQFKYVPGHHLNHFQDFCLECNPE